MSSLRGIRIQRNRPAIQPKPLLQSPSSSASEEDEKWNNKGFSASEQTKPKTMGPKSRTNGPKPKSGGSQNNVEYDELQLALALSMDPKQQADKEHAEFLAAVEKSKLESSRGNNSLTKNPTDKSGRPFTGRSFDNWLKDDISSDDEASKDTKSKSSNNDSKKPASQNTKETAKKPAAPKSNKRDRSLSSDASSDDDESSDDEKTNSKKVEPTKNSSKQNEKTTKNLSSTTEDEDEVISKYPRNSKSQAKNDKAKKKPSKPQKNNKQAAKRSKYTEDSTSEEEEDNSESEEEEPKQISKPNVKLTNKEFQPAPKTVSRRKASQEASDGSDDDAEYDPTKGDSKRSSRSAKARGEIPLEILTETKQNRPSRGKPTKPSYGKHPIPNDQILEYVGSKRLLLYISCIAKQIVDSQRMRLFVDMFQNQSLEIDKSHPLHEMAPMDFYKDDGEIDKKLEELLEKPLEAGKEVLTEDGKHVFDESSKQKFLRFVLIPECIIHLLKKQFSMGDQDAEEFYQQSGSRE